MKTLVSKPLTSSVETVNLRLRRSEFAPRGFDLGNQSELAAKHFGLVMSVCGAPSSVRAPATSKFCWQFNGDTVSLAELAKTLRRQLSTILVLKNGRQRKHDLTRTGTDTDRGDLPVHRRPQLVKTDADTFNLIGVEYPASVPA